MNLPPSSDRGSHVLVVVKRGTFLLSIPLQCNYLNAQLPAPSQSPPPATRTKSSSQSPSPATRTTSSGHEEEGVCASCFCMGMMMTMTKKQRCAMYLILSINLTFMCTTNVKLTQTYTRTAFLCFAYYGHLLVREKRISNLQKDATTLHSAAAPSKMHNSDFFLCTLSYDSARASAVI